MLILVGNFLSCSKTGGSNMPVEYKSCPCEEGKSMQAIQGGTPLQDLVLREEAYVFLDALPEQLPSMYEIPITDNSGKMVFVKKYCIVYDSKTNDVCMYEWGHMHGNTGRICNFPNIADEIPENGCKVYFEGKMYESCEHIPRNCCNQNVDFYFGFDFILTHLEIR